MSLPSEKLVNIQGPFSILYWLGQKVSWSGYITYMAKKKNNKSNVLEINSNMLFGEQKRNHLSTRYIL